MKKSSMSTALLASLVWCSAGVAQAAPTEQQFTTRGFQFTVGLTGAQATVEKGESATLGIGVSLHAGYGFTRRLSLFAGGTGTTMESGKYALAHVDLGARFLLSDGELRPYVQAAWTGRQAREEIPELIDARVVQIRGVGPSVGAGVEYGVSPEAAVDIGLVYTGGDYTEGKITKDPWTNLGSESFSGRTLRLTVGVTARP
jgi:opacity protein-like surface antigen